LIAPGVVVECLLLASAACRQQELGMAEIEHIAEKRLGSETVAYRCIEIDYEKYPPIGERGKRIHDTKKKGDHVLRCVPFPIDRTRREGDWAVLDGEKIVFVSMYGVFQY
jgi:hypothetical protein